MKLTKETIWHFTCDFCKLWWSFASSDEFQPKKNIFCPHCGKKNRIDNEVQDRIIFENRAKMNVNFYK